MRLRTLTLLMLGFWLAAPVSAEVRKWTDITGKFSVEAELVEIQGKNVLLKRQDDGRVATVPIARLSKADQEYLRNLPPPDTPPAAPAVKPVTVKPATVKPATGRLEARLTIGSLVTLLASGQPVWAVLAQIEKSTGNKVRIMDEFGRDDEKTLSKQIALKASKRPFWEAIDALCTDTGLQFRGIKRGALVLSTKEPGFGKIEATGAPAVVGAFQVYPAFDDFFENAMIVIRPEPWISTPQLKGYQAQITFPDGKQAQYKPNTLSGTSNIHTGELKLRIDPVLPTGTQKAQQVAVEARLHIGSAWKTYTLPPLGSLTPRKIALGKGTVCVEQAGLEDRAPGRQDFVVKLRVEGMELDHQKIELVDTAGNRIKRSSGGASKGLDSQRIQKSFAAAKISGDPAACQLALEVPGGGEKTIGPLGKLAPKPAAAGATSVRVTKVRLKKLTTGAEELEVMVQYDGMAPSSVDVELIGRRGQPIQRTGFGSGSDYSATFQFDASGLGGKPESCKLRLSAPSRVNEYVLKATFNDVPLAKEE